jgi:hypothetical protein
MLEIETVNPSDVALMKHLRAGYIANKRQDPMTNTQSRCSVVDLDELKQYRGMEKMATTKIKKQSLPGLSPGNAHNSKPSPASHRTQKTNRNREAYAR